MPNFLFLLLSFAYNLALAIWIGGAIALGALTAPELFRQMPRQQAGGVFGPILRRFARLRLAAVVLAIIAAAIRHVLWETHGASPWIAIRWAALFVLAASVAYEIAALEPAMQRHRSLIRPEGGETDPNRLVFMVLHRRSEALMKLSLLAALLALFLA
jgi:Domain of unknown function (DUF4149)